MPLLGSVTHHGNEDNAGDSDSDSDDFDSDSDDSETGRGNADKAAVDQGISDLAEPIGELKTILEEAIAARTSENGSIDVKIKALSFPEPECGGDIGRIVFPLLKSALVDIETLHVPELLKSRTEEFCEEIVRKHCPRLRHLILQPKDGKVCSFIRGTTGVKTVRGSHYRDGNPYSETSLFTELAEHHADTLEEVEMQQCERLSSEEQRAILDSCQRLKREPGREWVYKLDEAGDDELDRVVDAWAAKQIYVQIGRLVVLETLALAAAPKRFNRKQYHPLSQWDLTLSKGWLAELTGLKNLRHLHMRTDFWSRMGQAEVEFMDAEWPLLRDSTMPIPPIFDLPELLALIIRLLHPCDIVQCIATSRAMTRAFEPFLYKHFYLGKVLHNDTSALSRNRHHLQSIDIRLHNPVYLQALTYGLPTDESTDKQILCTSLKRIALADFSVKANPPLLPYFTLLNSNDRLTYLQLPGRLLYTTEYPGTSLPVILSRLQHLQHLTVGNGLAPIQPSLDLLITALGLPHLEELYCKFSIGGGDTPLPLVEQALEDFLAQCRLDARQEDAASIGGGGKRRKKTGPKITALQLPCVMQAEPETFLLPLLQLDHIFDLERFYIPYLGLHGEQRVLRFRQVLKDLMRARFSKLKHLCCPSPDLIRSNTITVLEMIWACSGLRSFSGEWFHDEDSFMERLHITKTLLDQHAETLEVIEFPRCVVLESMDLKAILTRCRRLRRLWVWPSAFGQSMLEFVDASSEEWVCSGMTELSLSLGRATRRFDMPPLGSEEDERAIAHQLARKVYVRVGRLRHLTALALGCDGGRHTPMDQKEFEWDLTLSQGWLAELAGLKKLRVLYLRSKDFWAQMGQDEVEFMLEEWPALELIGLGGLEEEEVLERKALPHWRWLKWERPWLRLIYYDGGVMEHP
ncbi:hypothetical protein BGZ72_008196 [Mortierella alpina]|nr:hypothetical protein BGZ72_008196 [Mortierella alpina]